MGAAAEQPLDALVEQALDRAYLGQLSDVGRRLLLEERNPPVLEPEPKPSDPMPFFSGFGSTKSTVCG